MRLKKRRILKIKRRGRGYCMIIMIGYEMKYYKKKRRGYWRIIIIGYEIKYVWRYHKKVGRKGYNYNHLIWDKIRWDMEISDKRQAGEDIGYLELVAWLLPNGFSLHWWFPLYLYFSWNSLLRFWRFFIFLCSACTFPEDVDDFSVQRLPDYKSFCAAPTWLFWRIFICSAYLIGISNCTWSSCRHGCTAEVYKCWQVQVSQFSSQSQTLLRKLWLRESLSLECSQKCSREHSLVSLLGVTLWCHFLVSRKCQLSTSYWCICPTKVGLSRGINLQASHLTTTTLNSWSALIFEVNFTLVPKSAPIPPPWGSLSSLSSPSSSSSSSSSSSELEAAKPARLYPNVRGCGYPPTLHCDGQ